MERKARYGVGEQSFEVITIDSLMGLDLDDPNPEALFYQTGYLTIKKYDPDFDILTLGLPNKEVTDGFMNFLMPKYVRLHT